MSDLPAHSDLVGANAGTLYALMARHAEAVATTKFEFPVQRDRALLEAIDRALAEAARGQAAAEAAKPRWLDGLVGRELKAASENFWSRESFLRVRLLERLGLVAPEVNEVYVLAMVSSLGPEKPATLRSDPELIERALWRVFEVEGGGEVSLTNVDRFGGDEWRATFLELVADGTLDRGRVLGECLGALDRDFAAYRAGWYAATYLALAPTTEEADSLQPSLRRLLSAPVPATVALGLRQLSVVHKAGLLGLAETLEALPAAVVVKAKGTSIAALRLARSAGAEHRDAVVRIATAALGHPHADVQTAAARLLTDLDARGSVEAAGAGLAPAVQQDLGMTIDAVAEDVERFRQPLAEMPSPVTTDDLAERTAALLEDASDTFEFEAVLAALAVPGSERALTALRKRARRIVDAGDTSISEVVARLVLSLLGESAPDVASRAPALRFVVRRTAELRASAGPLLATPDAPGGWVTPATLVERVRRSPELRHHDVVAALLRLHPDGRLEVNADDLPAAVSFALTGAGPRSGPDAWWVASERSRAPYGKEEAPRITAEVKSYTWQQNGADRTSRYTDFALHTPIVNEVADDRPTELAGVRGGSLGDAVPALAAIWPHDAEHFLAHTARSVLESPNWPEAAHDVPRTLDALARHPGRMGTLATHTLAAGLSAAHRDHRFHAVDAFLDLVPTGRIAPGDLAGVMSTYSEAWPATRWAESFAAASQGRGGGTAVVALLTALLPRLPVTHRGLNRLLAVLRDETIRQGVSVTEPALREWLAQLSGSSAAAKTATSLLR